MKEEHLQKYIVDEFEYNFFPICFDESLEFKSGDYFVKNAIGTSYHKVNKIKDDQIWSTSKHYLNDITFKNTINFLFLYFNRIKRTFPKPVLANVCGYLR